MKKAILIFLAFGIMTLFVIPIWAKYQQQQKYTGTFTANEAQLIVNAITNPDDYSVNQRKQIANDFAKGLVPVTDSTKPKK